MCDLSSSCRTDNCSQTGKANTGPEGHLQHSGMEKSTKQHQRCLIEIWEAASSRQANLYTLLQNYSL